MRNIRAPSIPYVCPTVRGSIPRVTLFDADIGAADDISANQQLLMDIPSNQLLKIETFGTKTETIVFHLRDQDGDKIGAVAVDITIPAAKVYDPGQTIYELVQAANANFAFDDMPAIVSLFITAPTGSAIKGRIKVTLTQSRD